ncbi:MAG: hypothetical protein MUF10_17910, partial [Thermoanaerobaculaceae bacterium]|nr:hypothetical protein [Thermoanaerobaculaceae bacterium]
MAAALFQRITSAGCIEAVVCSAGLYAHPGEAVAEHAAEVMREEGIELAGHSAVQVSVDDLRWADAVVSVTEAHAGDLRALYPALALKVLSLAQDVPDPYRGSLADYR